MYLYLLVLSDYYNDYFYTIFFKHFFFKIIDKLKVWVDFINLQHAVIVYSRYARYIFGKNNSRLKIL